MKKLLTLTVALSLTLCVGVLMSSCAVNTKPSTGNGTYMQTITTERELAQLVVDREDGILGNDIKIVELFIPTGTAITVDLGEYNLSAVEGFVLLNQGTLTLKGSGTVSFCIKNNGTLVIDGGITFESGATAIKNDGDLTVKNGTFLLNDANAEASLLENNGTAVVDNATFSSVSTSAPVITSSGEMEIHNATVNGNYGALVINGGNTVINDGVYTSLNNSTVFVKMGSVQINGGSFICANDGFELKVNTGATASYNKNVDFANGKIDADGSSVTQATSEVEEIREILNNGGNVTLEEDVTADANTGTTSGYGKTGIVVNGNIFDGNGKVLTVENSNGTWDCGIHAKGGTIKNVSVEGSFRGIFTSNIQTDLYIDNVILDKVCYTFNADGTPGSKAKVFVTNSTLNGWTSYSNMFGLVSFTDCKFGKGTGAYEYAYCRPYNVSLFTNCVFEEGFTFDSTQTTSTFVNCYVGETLITAENVVELLGNIAYNIKFPVKTDDAEELKDSLVEGEYVTLEEDVEVEGVITQQPGSSINEAYGNEVGVVQYGGTFDGNGKTLTDTDNKSWLLVTHGGTIKNLTIASGSRGIVTYEPKDDVIIDNVIIDGPGYAINSSEYGAVKLIVTNSTVNGWTSFAGFTSVSFTNCNLGENTKKYWQERDYIRDYDRLLRPYLSTVLTNCVIEQDYYFSLKYLGENDTVTLINCKTSDGTLITAQNYMNYITVESAQGHFVINGETVY